VTLRIEIQLPKLDNLQAQIPQALTSALNSTAYVAKRDTEDAMRRNFDRPTPWVMRSIEYGKTGEKGNAQFESSVFIKEGNNKADPRKTLIPEFEGGVRQAKGLEGALFRIGLMYKGEFAVPTKHAAKDAYGNVPSSFVNQIISAMGAFREVGSQANRTKRSGIAFKIRNRGDWVFPAQSGRYQRSKLKRGIYWRDNDTRTLTMWFKFVRHQPTYRQRINLHTIAQGAIKKEFWTKFAQKIR
jgi:hypothetical protein